MKRLRLEAAATLLRTSRLSVKEVAGAVGCPDVSHFVRDFRRAHGVTPSDFRRTARAPVPARSEEPSGVSVLANE